MPSLLRQPITFGIASAAMFLLLNMLGFNSLFLILSAIPLLYFGQIAPFTSLVLSGAIASGALLLLSAASSLFYLALILLPSLLLVAHLSRGHSLLHGLADCAGYAIIGVSAMNLSLRDQGGIAGWLAERFNTQEFATIDPSLAEQMHWLSTSGSFLLVSIASWWAAIFLLIACWLTVKLLARAGQPSFLTNSDNIWEGAPPTWLLGALILSIGIGMMAPENIKFLGTTSFIIILLPYFFYGAIHTPLSKALKAGFGWSLVVSVVLMILAWPAFIIAAVGVFKHTYTVVGPNNKKE